MTDISAAVVNPRQRQNACCSSSPKTLDCISTYWTDSSDRSSVLRYSLTNSRLDDGQPPFIPQKTRKEKDSPLAPLTPSNSAKKGSMAKIPNPHHRPSKCVRTPKKSDSTRDASLKSSNAGETDYSLVLKSTSSDRFTDRGNGVLSGVAAAALQSTLLPLYTGPPRALPPRNLPPTHDTFRNLHYARCSSSQQGTDDINTVHIYERLCPPEQSALNLRRDSSRIGSRSRPTFGRRCPRCKQPTPSGAQQRPLHSEAGHHHHHRNGWKKFHRGGENERITSSSSAAAAASLSSVPAMPTDSRLVASRSILQHGSPFYSREALSLCAIAVRSCSCSSSSSSSSSSVSGSQSFLPNLLSTVDDDSA